MRAAETRQKRGRSAAEARQKRGRKVTFAARESKRHREKEKEKEKEKERKTERERRLGDRLCKTKNDVPLNLLQLANASSLHSSLHAFLGA